MDNSGLTHVAGISEGEGRKCGRSGISKDRIEDFWK